MELTPEQKADKELTALYQKHPEAFKGLVKLWVVWNSLGVLGVGLKNIMTVLAFFIGGWILVKGYLIDFVLGLVQHGPRP